MTVAVYLMLKKTGLVPVFLFWFLCLTACSPSLEQQLDHLQLPAATAQLLLVTTVDWQASSATLQRMEKSAGHWRSVGERIPVRIGRNGLGWGVGLHQEGAGVQKQEGDGKAPAGVFPLGMVFGDADQLPVGLQMPYRIVGDRDYFVDAVDSPDYNRWRTLPPEAVNDPTQYWHSFERMRRDDDQYALGVIVGHNMFPTTAGRGSAIFLHVWLNPDTATSGCTAMAKADLLRILMWLKPAANPLLLQVPADHVASLRFPGVE